MDSKSESQESCFITWAQLLGLPVQPRGSSEHLAHHGLAHGYSHVDPQVSVVSEQLCYGSVKDEAVRVHDGRADPLMDRPGGGLPGQPPPVAIQF